MAAFLVAFQAAGSCQGADFMFRARVDGQMLEGQPLHWSQSQMLLLGRDGQLYEFNPKKAKEAQKTSPRFFGYTISEMKRSLYEEFGDRFDLTTTNRYVVVHPRGERDQWANRFEQMYRSFNRFFQIRGFTPRDPKFPLVAIIFRNQDEYLRYAASIGTKLQPGTLGHYDPKSNRVFLYDMTAENGGDWSANAATIIHEVTHQTAYNTGIHKRFASTPRWVAEGLATMFEARGVWDSSSHRELKDRLNLGRLHDFKEHVTGRRKPESLVSFLATDQAFRTDPAGAYAEAWALSFFLMETRPRLYCEYLAKTADRPLFSDYSASERVADFESVFGSDLRMLEVKFLRFMEELE
jgi:hypothetical protein